MGTNIAFFICCLFRKKTAYSLGKNGAIVLKIKPDSIKFASRLLANLSAFVWFHPLYAGCYYAKAESILYLPAIYTTPVHSPAGNQ